MPLSLSLYVRLGGGLRLFQKRGDGPASLLFVFSVGLCFMCALGWRFKVLSFLSILSFK